MFIPIRSDRPLRTTPYVNYALIAACVLIYAATSRQLEQAEQYKYSIIDRVYNQVYGEEYYSKPIDLNQLDQIGEEALTNQQILDEAHRRANELTREKFPVYGLMLHKYGTGLWQFITYQFLHASPMHLIGNLIFLFVFGNAVEDRLGKFGYLLFYLTMGVFAGLGHWLTSDAAVLGASGSIAGVTGAFLALFPRTHITFVYFFFFIGMFEVPAMLVVAFYFVKDLVFFGMDIGNVAYTAHLAGNLAGFLVAMALLAPRLLPREPYDLFSLWTHKRRRDNFKKIAQQGYQAWEGRVHQPEAGKRWLGKGNNAPAISEAEQALIEKRQAISRAITSHDMQEAGQRYIQLLAQHGDQTLSQKQQFDIANHLAGISEHAAAARAYELLLKAYPSHDQRAHVQLVLGLIYTRYLGRANEAKPLLQEASQRLTGDDAALARQLLTELQ